MDQCISVGLGRINRQGRRSLLALVVTAGGAQLAQAQPTFITLGHLPGGASSVARSVNGDGSVVVGWATDASGTVAFRWTASDGMVSLGDLPGGRVTATPWGISDDGSVVVGNGETASGNEGFRWTAAGGMMGLGSIPDYWSYCRGVSGDGMVAVGSDPGPVRWTGAGGWEVLAFDPQISSGSGYAAAANRDGSVIVGTTDFGRYQAFRWTGATGMVNIGGPDYLNYSSDALGVSADGSVVVGSGPTERAILSGIPGNGPHEEAFIWRAGTGMRALGDLPGGDFDSRLNDVSADGAIAVGFATSGMHPQAAFYTESLGLVDLRQWLMERGVSEVGAWPSFDEATAISADGRTIVGYGSSPTQVREGWVVRLDVVCPADINGDLAVNSQDFFDFLRGFFAGSADFNRDGAVNSQDFFDFVAAFFAGC